MNLQKLTTTNLQHLIEGAVIFSEFGETIDERKNLEYKIADFDKYFKVYYSYNIGCIVDKEPNPIYQNDKDITIENYFMVMKTESKNKVMREVLDMLNEVNSVTYEDDLIDFNKNDDRNED